MNVLKDVTINYLREAANDIESNHCELSEEQLKDVLHMLAHRPLSKEQACNFMHLSRSAFDTRIAKGEIPRGRKRSGFKELVWFEDELEEAKLNYKN